FLTQNRANVNSKDENGWTSIHYAAFHGYTSCAAVLFKNGAKLELTTIDGQTPLSIAIQNQKADCVTLLRLARLARNEENSIDESFMEALENFSYDAHSPIEEKRE